MPQILKGMWHQILNPLPLNDIDCNNQRFCNIIYRIFVTNIHRKMNYCKFLFLLIIQPLTIFSQTNQTNKTLYDDPAIIKILEQTRNAGQIDTVVDLMLDMSETMLRQGRIDNAMVIIFRAQNLITQESETPDQRLLGKCNQMLGSVFFTRYMEPEAIVFLNKSLVQFFQSKDYQSTGEVLRSLSESQISINEVEKSTLYLNALLSLYCYTGDEYIGALTYEAWGDYFDYMGKYDKAAAYYKKSLQIYTQYKKLGKASDMLLSICLSEENKGDTKTAIFWADSALRFNERNHQQKNYFEALYYKASCISKSDPTKAISIANSALDSLESLNLSIHQGIYLKFIVGLQRKTGAYQEALQNSDRFYTVLNEIYGSDAERKIASLQLEVETEKLNHRIAALQKEQQLVIITARSQRNMVFYFILASIVLLSMALNNMRRLQYRLYLLKEFAMDITFARYVLYFLVTLIYFSFAFITINPLQINELSYTEKWIHCGAIGFIASIVVMGGIIMLPVTWSAKPGFNRKFSLIALAFILLLNITILAYAAIFKLAGNSVFDAMNIMLVLTGITIMPVFFIIIFLEKVLLRKHIQMAGLLTNKIHQISAENKDEELTIFSEKTRDVVKIAANSLLAIEAQGNYSKIHFKDQNQIKSTMILASLKHIESQLYDFKFITRCHKSYIVNLKMISKVMGNSHGYKLELLTFNQSIPVSRSFTEIFIKSLDQICDSKNSVVKV